MTVARCEKSLGRRGRCGTVLVERIDGIGRMLFECPRCVRRAAGFCWQCGRPRSNDRARGLYCSTCFAASYRESQKRCEASAERKEKRGKYDRMRWLDPEVRARKVETRRAWMAAHPEKVLEYKRREALNPTPRKKQRERWWNAQPERIQKKREQARARYYELHPTRPNPTCTGCARPITWSPPGRPPMRCDECVPPSIAKKRLRPAPPVTLQPGAVA